MYRLPSITRILQSNAVFHRLQWHSLDKVFRKRMPQCPQTIPGSLLDPNFSSVLFRHTTILVVFFYYFLFIKQRKENKNFLQGDDEIWISPITSSLFFLQATIYLLMNASHLLSVRPMVAGTSLMPEEQGGGGDNQRRKKRLSSRGFEQLSSTQVRVPWSLFSPCDN